MWVDVLTLQKAFGISRATVFRKANEENWQRRKVYNDLNIANGVKTEFYVENLSEEEIALIEKARKQLEKEKLQLLKKTKTGSKIHPALFKLVYPESNLKEFQISLKTAYFISQQKTFKQLKRFFHKGYIWQIEDGEPKIISNHYKEDFKLYYKLAKTKSQREKLVKLYKYLKAVELAGGVYKATKIHKFNVPFTQEELQIISDEALARKIEKKPIGVEIYWWIKTYLQKGFKGFLHRSHRTPIELMYEVLKEDDEMYSWTINKMLYPRFYKGKVQPPIPFLKIWNGYGDIKGLKHFFERKGFERLSSRRTIYTFKDYLIKQVWGSEKAYSEAYLKEVAKLTGQEKIYKQEYQKRRISKGELDIGIGKHHYWEMDASGLKLHLASEGKDYNVLLFIDRHTREIIHYEFVDKNKKHYNAEFNKYKVAKAIKDAILKTGYQPKKFVFDNAKAYLSDLVQDGLEFLGIKYVRKDPYDFRKLIESLYKELKLAIDFVSSEEKQSLVFKEDTITIGSLSEAKTIIEKAVNLFNKQITRNQNADIAGDVAIESEVEFAFAEKTEVNITDGRFTFNKQKYYISDYISQFDYLSWGRKPKLKALVVRNLDDANTLHIYLQVDANDESTLKFKGKYYKYLTSISADKKQKTVIEEITEQKAKKALKQKANRYLQKYAEALNEQQLWEEDEEDVPFAPENPVKVESSDIEPEAIDFVEEETKIDPLILTSDLETIELLSDKLYTDRFFIENLNQEQKAYILSKIKDWKEKYGSLYSFEINEIEKILKGGAHDETPVN